MWRTEIKISGLQLRSVCIYIKLFFIRLPLPFIFKGNGISVHLCSGATVVYDVFCNGEMVIFSAERRHKCEYHSCVVKLGALNMGISCNIIYILLGFSLTLYL